MEILFEISYTLELLNKNLGILVRHAEVQKAISRAQAQFCYARNI